MTATAQTLKQVTEKEQAMFGNMIRSRELLYKCVAFCVWLAICMTCRAAAWASVVNFTASEPNEDGSVQLDWVVTGSSYAGGIRFNVAVSRSDVNDLKSSTILAGAYMDQRNNVRGSLVDTPPVAGKTYYYWLNCAPYNSSYYNNFAYLWLNGEYDRIHNSSPYGPITVYIPAPLTLSASDGTVPGGIEVTWTDDGTAQYELFRGETAEGPFNSIALVSTNAYFDSAVEWGHPYWYYVNRLSGQKRSARLMASNGTDPNRGSNVNEGLPGTDGVLPKIIDVDVGELWLTDEGPYYCFLTWNDFDKNRYFVTSVTFDLIRSNSGESVWSPAPTKVLSEGDQIEIFDLQKIAGKSIEKGKHGQYELNVTWEVADKVADKVLEVEKQPGKRPCVCDDVKVFFHKYEMEGGIPNWFRYWPSDGAISASKFDLGHWNQYDGKFRFCTDVKALNTGTSLKWDENELKGDHSNDPQYTTACVSFDRRKFPHIQQSIGECKHRYLLGINAAAHGDKFELLNIDDEGSRGLAALASVVAHESQHGELADDLYGRVGALLFVGEEAYNFNIESVSQLKSLVDEYPMSILDFNWAKRYRYKQKIGDAMNGTAFVTDFDGDGIADDTEISNAYSDWGFSVTNPDSLGIASFFNEPARTTYSIVGDNEVLARAAVTMVNKRPQINTKDDWAWPGNNVLHNYEHRGQCPGCELMGLYWKYPDAMLENNGVLAQDQWCEIGDEMKKVVQRFARKSRKDWTFEIQRYGAEKNMVRKGTANVNPATGRLNAIDKLPEVLSKTGSVYVVSVEPVEKLLSDDSLSEMSWNLVLTNENETAVNVSVYCYMTDENTNALAWISTNLECIVGLSYLTISFDAQDFFLENPSRLMLYSVSIENSVNRITQQKIGSLTTAFCAHSNFAIGMGWIVPNSVTVDVTVEGVTVSGDVIRFSDDAAQIHAMLTDTNGLTVISTTIEAAGIGTNRFSMFFPGEELYRLAKPLPYAVESLRLVENGMTVHEIDVARTVNAENVQWFRPADLMIHAFAGSGAWVEPLRGADGLCSQITYSFAVSNAENVVKSCHVWATLLGTNEEHISSLNLPVALTVGTNMISISFSSIDMKAHDYDGGVYHIGNIFIESDEGEGIEVLHTDGNSITVPKNELGGVPFMVKGVPQYREAVGKNPASVDVTVDVARPDTITASALLVNGEGEYVAMARTNMTVNEVGERTLTLAFDPGEITASGRHGPYTISYLLLKSGIEGVEDIRLEDFAVRDVKERSLGAYVTATTPESVEYSWLESYPEMLATFSGNYEAMASASSPGASGGGKMWPDGSPYYVWQDFVAGTSPTNDSVFRASVHMEGNVPVVTWEPDTPELRATRVYRTFGKKTLLDVNWTDITDKDQSEYRFFKVKVEMP